MLMPQRTLPDGSAIPALGLGTWRMGERAEARAAEILAVREALRMGYRLIDTAEMYGEGGAESMLGEALRQAFAAGEAQREDLTIVSKVYPHHASTRGVVEACERSLQRLKLDRIDLYLLHWRGEYALAETLAGFAQLQSRGLILHWGVSNFDVADLEELFALPGGSACATNQVYYSLGARGVEFDLLPWQARHRLPLMAYSPIDQGALGGHTPRCRRSASGSASARLRWRWPGCCASPRSLPSPRPCVPRTCKTIWPPPSCDSRQAICKRWTPPLPRRAINSLWR
ncbi:putative 2,5-diketo-D-gluconic acid reductase A (2,5-DKG reductase A) (2,5-DKGR A) (25DKGR-A) (AKR5C), dkgA [Thiomonas arsenitoxydans]|uniref:2,5-diketo-D-gluconic acid reductase A (2,5-DKG reductase A) (2,5-DKGR A) (25DKGR-A) (AKR5C), dkgA n=1 Tax=Thiomonas arsenitoxydans (strain DSM 22701 / CIP 110005 / 3As) TaxID=426114 RepID=D6CV59_THIA3|nr:putative 2,5-diketo-D-gluconic acid reductase A (2,5-DKG reductase A) (2,5-DKGR A) (25DKGR-A) (AKR5C), dkgA [Thiomonas arsenitoxydans]